ncbi:glycerol-3-phosphate cytidylyltransferase [Carnobacterium mobile]|uniref:glycerol-3-phosphate cytidylyltransferase n=1 Tax=Carnobacterium mobile TaxID=2750 RepID=UPI0018661786|nr:glycerol-3-phosphate cytidylyltransferase [Carnobacterium mobile]
MKKVLTYGTFDLLHKGHVLLLQRARALGDHLTVAISTDEFNAIKGKKAYTSWEDRKMILEALACVDEVIPENEWEQKVKDVKKYDIDLFVMGDDWEGKFDFLKEYCQVVYLPRTEGVSTTKIKEDLKEIKAEVDKLSQKIEEDINEEI